MGKPGPNLGGMLPQHHMKVEPEKSKKIAVPLARQLAEKVVRYALCPVLTFNRYLTASKKVNS